MVTRDKIAVIAVACGQQRFELFLTVVAENAGTLAGMPRALHGLSALEVGCGSGPICCFLAARGWVVRGIDVSQTALETADQVATELRNTGFVIQSQRTLEQKDPRKPMLMQIRAGQRAA